MFSLIKVQEALSAAYLAESDSCHWALSQRHELGVAHPLH
uniref:Uncharacterized protein n=1 Tax=Curvibacter symbiont subsp. Hydra magnipapillata TaxID=667019 RepID=C9Y7K7_CURXX|nr:hypothetical protein Csp_A01080 [Curvibacter putative symbiont of Hydra magnipapillata]